MEKISTLQAELVDMEAEIKSTIVACKNNRKQTEDVHKRMEYVSDHLRLEDYFQSPVAYLALIKRGDEYPEEKCVLVALLAAEMIMVHGKLKDVLSGADIYFGKVSVPKKPKFDMYRDVSVPRKGKPIVYDYASHFWMKLLRQSGVPMIWDPTVRQFPWMKEDRIVLDSEEAEEKYRKRYNILGSRSIF